MKDYQTMNTGGGCLAYHREIDSHRYVLVTDDGGARLPEDGEEALFGLYDEEDRCIEEWRDIWQADMPLNIPDEAIEQPKEEPEALKIELNESDLLTIIEALEALAKDSMEQLRENYEELKKRNTGIEYFECRPASITKTLRKIDALYDLGTYDKRIICRGEK